MRLVATGRRDDWPERLSAAIEAARAKTFVYGTHDCGLFVADGIEALTGQDVAADWRGRYATLAEALALIGVHTLAAIPAKVGLKPVHPALAHRGDVALALVGAPVRGRPAAMLMLFDGAVLRGAAGAVSPRGGAVKAWRVG